MKQPRKKLVEAARAALSSRRVRLAMHLRARAAPISSKRVIVGMLIVAGAAALIWTIVEVFT